jgi:DNA-binding response OmpR family regulator
MDLNDYKASKSHVENYDCIIVLCELDWSTDNEKVQRHQLSGIELVKKLRRENNCITPVLFVSFLSIESILNSDREILTSIGHDFLQLPATPNDFRTAILNQFGENGSIRKLSEMELTDIRSFYCSKEGILIHELHQLNSLLISPSHFKITIVFILI